MRRLLVVLALPSLLLLSACGDEPSEAAMRSALEARMDADRRQLTAMAGSAAASILPTVRVVEFKKGACREAQGQPGHACDFTVTAEANGRRETNSASGRFFKAGSGQLEMELVRR